MDVDRSGDPTRHLVEQLGGVGCVSLAASQPQKSVYLSNGFLLKRLFYEG